MQNTALNLVSVENNLVSNSSTNSTADLIESFNVVDWVSFSWKKSAFYYIALIFNREYKIIFALEW